MAEYPSSTGGGSWLIPHAGSASGQSQGQSSQNAAMREWRPFQCGICYEYCSSDVDELDDHILKHKRELAERLEAQAQPSGESQEVTYRPQNHQQMVYYEGPSHAETQNQVYEYPTQSCGNFQQAPQYREPRGNDYKTAAKYYAHHPFLLHHQPPPPSISNLYSNDSLSQAAADSNSMPQDEFATVQMKCGRYESHTYERDGQHNHHQADRPDLNEENTADADPSTDSTKEDVEQGPLSFAEAQPNDCMTYHSTQSEKSENVSAAKSNSESGTQTGNFGSEHEDPLQEPDSAQRELENDIKHSIVQSLNKTESNDFDAELTSTVESSSKDLPRDGGARCDDRALKGLEDPSLKGDSFEIGHVGRIPRTRRSARMQTGRRELSVARK